MLEIPAPLPGSQAIVMFHVSAASHVWFGDDAGSGQREAPIDNVSEIGKHKPRALIVDDAPDVVEMLAILLRHSGYEVVTAPSAPDALSAAQDSTFDVVVSDIGMPGMNGYQLAEALRALPQCSAVPLIALTGFAMYENRDRAMEAGFNAFLTKPIDPVTLIELIERLRN